MRPTPSGSGSLGQPLALLAAGFFFWLAFQAFELVRESEALAVINRTQDTSLQDAARLRDATDKLAGDIASLAQSGDEAAKEVVDEMARQNIVLKPPGGSPASGQPTIK